MKRILAIICTAILASTTMVLTSAPASAVAEQHCIVHTDGVDKQGNFVVTGTDCYDKFSDVLRSAGATNVSDSISPASVSSEQLMMVYLIAVHYDGYHAAGGSMSVEGNDCLGGGLPVPLIWNDRFGSTTHGCGQIQHWQNNNYTGTLMTTYGPGNSNLIYLNNATSSIRYYY